jgi:hypothetical protein
MRLASGFPCALIYLRRESKSKPRAKPAAGMIFYTLSPHPEERRTETQRHRRTIVARLEGRGPGFQSAEASWFETHCCAMLLTMETFARMMGT